ncbi:hypothetical protein LSS_04009 [Leptospira santarosai serovar Shermani str. LT 821]|uniref:Uncharacterized protein n=1 Tax=Leptospira santarosai serovar Shermani str. LT 821 TaxID=758847 RepID=K8YFH6_9LEPT|nr:hypothetical protein LSS_04009 [Leptospira santarosai serovar Shermani str. LT 821]
MDEVRVVPKFKAVTEIPINRMVGGQVLSILPKRKVFVSRY